jgi:hypothetical protein
MALTLSFLAVERNDSKLLTLTDTSVTWTTPSYTDIQARTSLTYSLTLDITINTPTLTTVYDQLDCYVIGSGPFATQAAMIFPISAANLQISGSPLGTTDTELPDGIWDIVYKLQHYTGGAWVDVASSTISILMYGQIKTKVYDKLRKVPKWSELSSGYRDINEASYYYTYLQAIEKSAFVARKAELLQMLETLERLLLNGSNYPW